jgi:threonine dehydrogenase-like Zn-dependent dehydrogenase
MKTDNRPIWGFPAELSYLALFSLLVVSGVAFRIWYETDRRVTDDGWDTVVEIIIGTGQIGLAAATCTAGIAAISEVIMIVSERYKARRFAEGLAEGRAEGRAEGLADAVERAIRQTAEEISQGVEVQIDTSQWFSRDVMRVVIKRGESRTEAFEVTMEQALSSRLHPLLKDRIESLD